MNVKDITLELFKSIWEKEAQGINRECKWGAVIPVQVNVKDALVFGNI